MKYHLFLKSALLFISLLLSTLSHAATAPMPVAPTLTAKAYVLYDFTSNQILVNHNGNDHMEPASLTKMMTAYLSFKALRDGTIHIGQRVIVPAAALLGTEGESLMLLKTGQSVSIDTLLHGLIIQSGNDAATTLAISIAGSEEAFVEMMNKEAQRLGQRNTHYTNPVGMPDAQHYSSATDLAIMAAALIRDFPQYYTLFGQRSFTFNNVTQANRNRLLWIDPYADGLKTGHTNAAGYCLAGSTVRDNRRLISIVLGADSDNLRTTESQKLLNFGFQNYDAVRLYRKNEPVTRLRIWKGTEKYVGIGFKNDTYLSIPKGMLPQLKATMETHQPILAPIDNRQQLGVLKLKLAGKPFAELPLRALDSIPEANVFSRGWDSIRLFFQ